MLIFSAVATAQGLRPGVEAGVNFQNLNGKDQNGVKSSNKLITGFHAGVNVLMPIAPEIYFQPGLLFAVKGATYDLIPNNVTVRLNYLELPLNLVYRGQLGNNFILLGFGPYVAYALNGKYTINDVKTNVSFQSTMDQNTSGVALRRFDAGANIFAGYELSGGIYLTLNAQLGLINVNPKNTSVSTDKSTLKNTGFGISLGYRF
jgi:hypothetical protein